MSFPSEKPNDEPIIVAQQLKMQFHSTRKGDGETIDTYLKNLKSIADSLAANGNPVSDPDLVLQLVAGLPSPQYSPYQSRISSQYPLPDFSDACSLLYMYESLLQASCTGSDNSDLEEENDNSYIEKFAKIVGVFNSVSNVVITACDVWSMFRPSSTTNTMGNKNFTRRRNRRRGRK